MTWLVVVSGVVPSRCLSVPAPLVNKQLISILNLDGVFGGPASVELCRSASVQPVLLLGGGDVPLWLV
jgi:hypothetical protein